MTRSQQTVWHSKEKQPLITLHPNGEYLVHPATVTRAELAELVEAGQDALDTPTPEPIPQRAD